MYAFIINLGAHFEHFSRKNVLVNDFGWFLLSLHRQKNKHRENYQPQNWQNDAVVLILCEALRIQHVDNHVKRIKSTQIAHHLVFY